MKKKILLCLSLSSLLLAPFMMTGFCYSSKVAKAEDTQKVITIDKTSIKVGEPIKLITNLPSEGTIRYKWLINGKETSNPTNQFIPSFESLEAWLEVQVLCNEVVIGKDKAYISNLPVVYIDTVDDVPITSRDTYIDAKMTIQGNNRVNSYYSGDIEIKGRGTSSWHYEKKPFKIKLDKKTDLFGFGKSKHYVLLANYLDPSCMRNTIAAELTRSLGLANSQTTYVDVILNGEFQGNYQLAEHIRVGSNIVDIYDWESLAEDFADGIAEAKGYSKDVKKQIEEELKTNLFWLDDSEYRLWVDSNLYNPNDYVEIPESFNGGYLFEISNSTSDEPSYFESNKGIGISVSKPEYAFESTKMKAWIQNFFNDYEEAINSYDGYNSKGVHYSELADFNSMIDYWLINEIMGNEDAAGRSRYAYIPMNGKLTFGPTWDFDISSFSYRSLRTPYDWAITGTINGLGSKQDFYKEFVDDPYFQVKAQERYWHIREYLMDLMKSDGLINNLEDNIYESLIANENKWLTEDTFVQRSSTGTAGDVAIFKDYLNKRITWLDHVFDTEDSINEALYMDCSSHPNKKSENITIECLSLNKDENEHGSNYLLNDSDTVTIKVNSNLKDLNLYINGIKYLENVETNKEISIPSELFKNEETQKSVIFVANENESSYTTIRNDFYTYFERHDGSEDFYLCDCKPKDHKLIKVAKGTKIRDLYVVNADCYYCNVCHHYYTNSTGKTIFYKKDLLMSTKRQDINSNPNEPQNENKNTDYKLLFIISISTCTLLLAGLITSTLIFKRKLKK